MADARLTQLARLLGLPRSAVDEQTAPALVSEGASALSAALFQETIASDDVIGIESALSYLDDRLRFLAPYVDARTASMVGEQARERLSSWNKSNHLTT